MSRLGLALLTLLIASSSSAVPWLPLTAHVQVGPEPKSETEYARIVLEMRAPWAPWWIHWSGAEDPGLGAVIDLPASIPLEWGCAEFRARKAVTHFTPPSRFPNLDPVTFVLTSIPTVVVVAGTCPDPMPRRIATIEPSGVLMYASCIALLGWLGRRRSTHAH